MTNEDFKRIRAVYQETQLAFGRRLGWEGPEATIKRKVSAYELGERPIVGPLAALLVLLDKLGSIAR
jgi:hypothetical protein